MAIVWCIEDNTETKIEKLKTKYPHNTHKSAQMITDTDADITTLDLF